MMLTRILADAIRVDDDSDDDDDDDNTEGMAYDAAGSAHGERTDHPMHDVERTLTLWAGGLLAVAPTSVGGGGVTAHALARAAVEADNAAAVAPLTAAEQRVKDEMHERLYQQLKKKAGTIGLDRHGARDVCDRAYKTTASAATRAIVKKYVPSLGPRCPS